MINATFESCRSPPRRTPPRRARSVALAVPCGAVGTVSDGTRVRFLAGSLDAAQRPTVRLGHEGPPIGRVASSEATEAGLGTSVRVSQDT